MDELRLVRREDRALIVATETGEEFRLVVDETVLAELRHLGRPERSGNRVSPREIQALVRAGKSRAEIAETTGADDADIERYEEPVLAERRYILETAHAVRVRTNPTEEPEEQFGAVIAERLVGLAADDIEWSAWRDEEAGWMVGLNFVSHEVEHRAVWSFEHRKGLLSPITPDATTLSKQGEVGERLIPKLRAVDAGERNERFDSDAFDPDQLQAGLADDFVEADEHERPSDTKPLDPDAEFARRREIDQRAISTPQPEIPDLGQTADLLDALRRRRGERDEQSRQPVPAAPAESGSQEPDRPERPGQNDTADLAAFVDDGEPESGWLPMAKPAQHPKPPQRSEPQASSESRPEPQQPSPSPVRAADPSPEQDRGNRKRNRASIPSWDDILFGTRSEDDPA